MTERGALRVIEICAGAGGQALGLEKAGFEHELAVELDENAVNTLRHNRPEWKVVQGDVADREVWNPEHFAPREGWRLDLLAGGVPCPPFTIAGKQLGATDERDLFAWAVEQVKVVRPRALLLENVRGLSMPRFSGYRQHVLDRLQEFGYSAEWRLLHASKYGVPQLRPRFVLVAMEPDDFARFHWPTEIGDPPSVGETLFPLMSANGWKGAEEWAEKANDIAPTIVGGSKKHGGADLGPTRAKRAWAEMGVDALGIANHAPNPDDVFAVGPKLTCEMVALLQGWDHNEFKWEFTGKKTSTYRQIGNAFPPPVAKALGVAIAAALNGTSEICERGDVAGVDKIYRALRSKGDFMTAAQIAQATKLELEPHELERRISLLSRDFQIEIRNGKAATAYKLGEFKAFLGQDDHVRHDQFHQLRAKIS
ncbi:DNA cytosine methyltransferase [Sphaerisporangium fuscum]|uniref:DNA cytosine methyltransferase n=1 Tax=Sphaerisporangium fuscum TaxID=2835868 RepID=UPI0027E35A2C|nr:DNA (cytosine-5-)-methyltransferase [Sphaerisporangium fuscum]